MVTSGSRIKQPNLEDGTRKCASQYHLKITMIQISSGINVTILHIWKNNTRGLLTKSWQHNFVYKYILI